MRAAPVRERATPPERLGRAVPLAVTGLWLLLAGCQAPAPSRVQLELPELILSANPVRALLWQWDDKNQRSEAKDGIVFQVEPADLAAVSKGMLSCRRSGDGQLVANIGEAKSGSPVRCRLVHHLEAPDDLGRVDIQDGPIRLAVGAYTKEGEELADVPLKITTRNTKIARSDGDKLVPLEVGRAKVEVRAGDVAREFAVQIVRRQGPEALPIDKDTRLHMSLEPGRYELTVELELEKKLSMEWRGAPYCNYTGIGKTHVGTCVLRTKGGVVFDNPAFLNRGERTASHEGVTLLEIPE